MNMVMNKLATCLQEVADPYKLFQGSGAGGGALAVHADGDLIIGDGFLSSI